MEHGMGSHDRHGRVGDVMQAQPARCRKCMEQFQAGKRRCSYCNNENTEWSAAQKSLPDLLARMAEVELERDRVFAELQAYPSQLEKILPDREARKNWGRYLYWQV